MANQYYQTEEHPLNFLSPVENYQQPAFSDRGRPPSQWSFQVSHNDQASDYESAAFSDNYHSPEIFQAVSPAQHLISSPNSGKDLSHMSFFQDQNLSQCNDRVPTTRQSSNSILHIVRSLWFEVLCLALLIVILVAIVITLASHQDRPLPQWPLKITINTLVSAYAVVLKSLMLFVVAQGLGQLRWQWFFKSRPLADMETFDTASRGPLGSIQLLWKLRAKQLVASSGALVVILALFIDPFVQQILHYYDCTTSVSSTPAFLPRTNFYDNFGSHIGAGLSDVPLDMKSSINSGLLAPGSVALPFNCPTGNCTFHQSYHTVGYCSHCDDVSKDLEYSCHPGPTTSTTNGNVCSYTLPSNLSVSSDSDEGDELPRTLMTVATSGFAGQIQILNSFNQIKAYLQNGCSAQPWACMGAVGCNLYPCVKEFRAEVKGGNLTEALISTSSAWNVSGTLDVDCLSPAERQALVRNGYNITSSSRWIPYVGEKFGSNPNFISAPYDARKANSSVPAKCLYSIHFLSQDSMSYFLYSYFNGTVVTAGSYTQDSADNTGPLQLTGLYSDGNVSLASLNTSFTGVSDALTTTMRQTGNVNYSSPAVGRVFHYATCVSIRWGWLALPTALVGLTILFAVATLVQTVAYPGGGTGAQLDWKSSQLALLFHGLADETRDRFGTLDQAEDMDSAAKRANVRLARTEKGWRLEDVDGPRRKTPTV